LPFSDAVQPRLDGCNAADFSISCFHL
jgi:hypothetical protein